MYGNFEKPSGNGGQLQETSRSYVRTVLNALTLTRMDQENFAGVGGAIKRLSSGET